MMKPYQQTPAVRFANQIAIFTMKIGIAPKYQYTLGVRGRKSGKAYSTPVYLVEEKDKRWLVSPYGEVAWVQNARAAGEVTLTKDSETKKFGFVELKAEESAPVLKKYLALAPITQPYFDAQPDAPVESFSAEASRHPVFKLMAMKMTSEKEK
jgi:deazaflavin-dependent oxidoreductase (nitroreductase family)